MAAYSPDELRNKESQDPNGVYDKKGWVDGSPGYSSADLKEKLSNGENSSLAQQALSNEGAETKSLYGGSGLSKHQPLSFRLRNLRNLSNRRKIAIGASLVTVITTIILSFFLTSSFELLQFKHLLTDKIAASENHTYVLGNKKLFSTQFFFDKNGQFSGDKVGGIRRLMGENRQTKAMVNDLEKNGYKISFNNGKVSSLTGPDGLDLKSNSDVEKAWSIKRSGDLDNILKQVYPDKSGFWYSRSTAKLYGRWGLTRSDWLRDSVKKGTGVTALENMELKFRQALRQKLFGDPSSSVDLEDTATAKDPKNQTPGEQVSLANKGIFGQVKLHAQNQKSKLLGNPSAVPDASIYEAANNALDASSLQKDVGGAIASNISLSSLSLLGANQKACSASSALNSVVTGARVLRSAQLMKFAFSVENITDAVQNGQGVSSEEVSAMMQYLNSKDKNGKTLFQSSGWQYWVNPKATGLFASYDKNQRDEYSVGGGFTGTLASLQHELSPLASECGVVNNPFVSLGGLIVSLGAGILSGGSFSATDVAFNVGVGFAASFAVSVAEQMVTPMVAGTLINGAEQGTGVGNALVSGLEVLASVNGSNSGMRPLTTTEYKTQLAAIQQDQAQQLAETPILARLFSPNQDNSLTNDAVMGLASFNSSSIFSSIGNMGNLLHLGSFFGAPALAASTSGQCNDTDITNHHLVATPFCNLITGIPDSVMNNPNYAPDVVDQRMSCLDNSGNQIAGCTAQVLQDGSPAPNSGYAAYLDQCTADNANITGGMDIIHHYNQGGDGGYSSTCTNDLYNVYTLYMNEAQTQNDVLNGDLSPESPDGGAVNTSTAASSSSPTTPTTLSTNSKLIWPFATKNSTQYQRVDQGWDIQSTAGAPVYAIAAGTIKKLAPDNGCGFGHDYPTEVLDSSIGGPSSWIYYGHVHVLPSVIGQHVVAGEQIATANTTDSLNDCGASQNGSAAPAGWLEIGFAQPNTDAPTMIGSESTATADGQKMKDILLNAPVGTTK